LEIREVREKDEKALGWLMMKTCWLSEICVLLMEDANSRRGKYKGFGLIIQRGERKN